MCISVGRAFHSAGCAGEWGRLDDALQWFVFERELLRDSSTGAAGASGIYVTANNTAISARGTTDAGIRATSDTGIAAIGVSSQNTGVYGYSGTGYGVDGTGFVGVRGNGVVGVHGVGWNIGVEANGNTAPINLTGTIPGNPQNPLCKSTATSSAGTVGYCSSSRVLKEGIQDLELGLDTLMRLRPVAFRWKSNHSPDLGFIAEDVAKVHPLLAAYNESGKLQSVKYTQMTALLTKVLQEQVRERNKVEGDLKKQVTELQKHNADLTTQLREQQNLLKSLAARLSAVEQRSAAVK